MPNKGCSHLVKIGGEEQGETIIERDLEKNVGSHRLKILTLAVGDTLEQRNTWTVI